MKRIAYPIGLSLLVLLGLLSCQNSLQTGDLKVWIPYYQLDSLRPTFSYAAHALLVLPSGELIEGAQTIQAHHRAHPILLDSVWVIDSIRANPQVTYQIGGIRTQEGTYKLLQIYAKVDSVTKRLLECIVPAQDTVRLSPRIEAQRGTWMELCNAHQVAELVHTVYDPHTIYVNHWPPVVGADSLIPVYGYMNNPAYHLSLSPIIVEPVNQDIVFEIGQCVGSYGGKYIFIWKRDEHQEWKVLVDANI